MSTIHTTSEDEEAKMVGVGTPTLTPPHSVRLLMEERSTTAISNPMAMEVCCSDGEGGEPPIPKMVLMESSVMERYAMKKKPPCESVTYMATSSFHRPYLPPYYWLRKYKPSDIFWDLNAGLVVGIMIIPQGMACEYTLPYSYDDDEYDDSLDLQKDVGHHVVVVTTANLLGPWYIVNLPTDNFPSHYHSSSFSSSSSSSSSSSC